MEGKSIQYRQRNRRNFSPSTTDEELEEIAASEEAIKEAMEVEDMFTKDEVARRSYEKAEKFRRDQAAQIRYVKEEGIKAMIIAEQWKTLTPLRSRQAGIRSIPDKRAMKASHKI